MRSVLIVFWLSSVALAYPPRDRNSVLTLTDSYDELTLLSMSNETMDTKMEANVDRENASINFDEIDKECSLPPAYPVTLDKFVSEKSLSNIRWKEKVKELAKQEKLKIELIEYIRLKDKEINLLEAKIKRNDELLALQDAEIKRLTLALKQQQEESDRQREEALKRQEEERKRQEEERKRQEEDRKRQEEDRKRQEEDRKRQEAFNQMILKLLAAKEQAQNPDDKK